MRRDGSRSVTVLLVTYNQESFVGDAVRSVLAQTYQPLRILISDDCSSDGTFSEIERTVARYGGPHEVRTNRNPENMGLIGHLYRCIELIDTEWIVAAAGDDISEPQRVQRLMDFLDVHPGVDAMHSAVRDMRASGQLEPSTLTRRLERLLPPFCPAEPCIRERLLGLVMFWRGAMFGGSAAWKRQLWTAYPRIDGNCGEDTVIGFRAAIGGGVGYVREPLMRYRHHSSNLWSVASDQGAEARKTLETRRARMVLAALGQHLSDLDAAERSGLVSMDLAAEVRGALGLKQALVHASAKCGQLPPALVAGLHADAAFAALALGPQTPGVRSRIGGWAQRGLQRLLAGHLLRSLRRGVRGGA